ncbi:hypothetical protein SODALDRAFT_380957, partial [Sodiomyces alkalinus F11]
GSQIIPWARVQCPAHRSISFARSCRRTRRQLFLCALWLRSRPHPSSLIPRSFSLLSERTGNSLPRVRAVDY